MHGLQGWTRDFKLQYIVAIFIMYLIMSVGTLKIAGLHSTLIIAGLHIILTYNYSTLVRI